MNLRDKCIVIIGGSSGMGLETARQAMAQGAKVIIAGRSLDKLTNAKNQINSEALQIKQLNNRDENAIKEFFASIGHFDHLFTPGASYDRGSIEVDFKTAQSSFDGKFWPQYLAVKYALPYLTKNGSIVLMSGAASQRPLANGVSYAACNGAIESLGKALAVELAPIRVNVVSPGTIATSFRPDNMEKKRSYDAYKKQCLLRRIGCPSDVAQAVIYLMTNQYTTGSTLYPDGGYTLM